MTKAELIKQVVSEIVPLRDKLIDSFPIALDSLIQIKAEASGKALTTEQTKKATDAATPVIADLTKLGILLTRYKSLMSGTEQQAQQNSGTNQKDYSDLVTSEANQTIKTTGETMDQNIIDDSEERIAKAGYQSGITDLYETVQTIAKQVNNFSDTASQNELDVLKANVKNQLVNLSKAANESYNALDSDWFTTETSGRGFFTDNDDSAASVLKNMQAEFTEALGKIRPSTTKADLITILAEIQPKTLKKDGGKFALGGKIDDFTYNILRGKGYTDEKIISMIQEREGSTTSSTNTDGTQTASDSATSTSKGNNIPGVLAGFGAVAGLYATAKFGKPVGTAVGNAVLTGGAKALGKTGDIIKDGWGLAGDLISKGQKAIRRTKGIETGLSSPYYPKGSNSPFYPKGTSSTYYPKGTSSPLPDGSSTKGTNNANAAQSQAGTASNPNLNNFQTTTTGSLYKQATAGYQTQGGTNFTGDINVQTNRVDFNKFAKEVEAERALAKAQQAKATGTQTPDDLLNTKQAEALAKAQEEAFEAKRLQNQQNVTDIQPEKINTRTDYHAKQYGDKKTAAGNLVAEVKDDVLWIRDILKKKGATSDKLSKAEIDKIDEIHTKYKNEELAQNYLYNTDFNINNVLEASSDPVIQKMYKQHYKTKPQYKQGGRMYNDGGKFSPVFKDKDGIKFKVNGQDQIYYDGGDGAWTLLEDQKAYDYAKQVILSQAQVQEDPKNQTQEERQLEYYKRNNPNYGKEDLTEDKGFIAETAAGKNQWVPFVGGQMRRDFDWLDGVTMAGSFIPGFGAIAQGVDAARNLYDEYEANDLDWEDVARNAGEVGIAFVGGKAIGAGAKYFKKAKDAVKGFKFGKSTVKAKYGMKVEKIGSEFDKPIIDPKSLLSNTKYQDGGQNIANEITSGNYFKDKYSITNKNTDSNFDQSIPVLGKIYRQPYNALDYAGLAAPTFGILGKLTGGVKGKKIGNKLALAAEVATGLGDLYDEYQAGDLDYKDVIRNTGEVLGSYFGGKALSNMGSYRKNPRIIDLRKDVQSKSEYLQHVGNVTKEVNNFVDRGAVAVIDFKRNLKGFNLPFFKKGGITPVKQESVSEPVKTVSVGRYDYLSEFIDMKINK